MFRYSFTACLASLLLLSFAGCGETGRPASSADSASQVGEYFVSGDLESAPAPGNIAPTGPPTSVRSRHEASKVDDIRVSEKTVADMSTPVTERYGETEIMPPAKDKPFVPRNGRQSGILTAGSFDDVAQFDDYLSFLRRNHQQVSRCHLPLPPNAQQTVITVTDAQGKPLGNVRCVVTQSDSRQNERVLLDRSTGTDGRVMLLSKAATLRSQQAQPLRLQVYLGDKSDAIIDEYRAVDCRWQVTLQDAQSTLPQQLDLALVVDTTGSMGDELEYLKTEIDSIVASVGNMFPDIDQRFALITYRDNGDQYVCRSFDFTGSLSDFRRNLDAQSAQGGGDFPEAMDVALQNAEQLTWREGNTARVLFLVGDAPPHSQNTAQAMSAIAGLSQRGVRMFPVGASGVEKTAEVILRTASLLSMGQYLFLTDHSGVGNPHATPDVPAFAVERLDRLMLRMIASELAGKRLVAEEVIAIERGERYSYVAPMPCQTPTVCQPVLRCSLAAPKSTLTIVVDWFGKNVLATIVAVVSGAVVFERLSHFFMAC